MGFGGISPWSLLLILLIVVMIFGTKRLKNVGGDLGSAIGPPAAYILIPWIGLRGVYLLCAGLFAAGLALALLFRLRAR